MQYKVSYTLEEKCLPKNPELFVDYGFGRAQDKNDNLFVVLLYSIDRDSDEIDYDIDHLPDAPAPYFHPYHESVELNQPSRYLQPLLPVSSNHDQPARVSWPLYQVPKQVEQATYESRVGKNRIKPRPFLKCTIVQFQELI